MMVLEFLDINPEQLGETLFDSYLSAQLIHSPGLRSITPRLSWENQDDETKALWNTYAQRLIALYGQS